MDLSETGSFYVALFSDASLNYYPLNNSTNFANRLGKSLNVPLGLYECGISEVTFGISDKVFEKNIPIAPVQEKSKTPPVEEKFFGHEQDDNVLKIWKYVEVLLQIRNNQKHLSAFIEHLNKEFKKTNLEIIIVEQRVLGVTEAHIKIRNSDKDGRILLLPKSITDILGFDSQAFEVGEHTSQLPYNEKLYKLLPKEIFQIKAYWWKQETHEILEPSEHTLDDLLSHVALTLTTANLDIGINEKEVPPNYLITVDIHDPNIRLQFPPPVNTFLGLEKTFIFDRASTDILLPRIQPETPQVIEPLAPVSNSRECIFIQSDVIEAQHTGSSFSPVLRIIPLTKDIKGTVNLKFSPVLYVSPNSENISSIRVTFTDSYQNILPAPDTVSMCILHFRKKLI